MSKYTEFWNWFQDKEQQFFAAFEQGLDLDPQSEAYAQREDLLDELAKNLSNIDESLGFEFGPKTEDKYSFYITSQCDVNHVDDVIKLTQEAPNLNYFTVIAFRQRAQDPEHSSIKYNNVELTYDQLFFKSYVENNLIYVLIAVKGFSGNEELTDDDKDLMYATFVLLEKLLGEYDMATLIGDINFTHYDPNDQASNGLPLLKLRDLVDEFKQSLKKSNNTVDSENLDVSEIVAKLNQDQEQESDKFVLPSDEEIAKLTLQEKLDLARDVCNDDNYPKALEILESIKDQCTDNAVFYYRYAVNLMHTNRFKEALDSAKKSNELDKDYPWAYLILSQLLYWQNNFVEAYETAKAGLKVVEGNQSDEEEFLMVLLCMFKCVDFCDPNDFENSVLLTDFINYDKDADAEYKIGDVDSQWEKFGAYYDQINKNRPALDFYIKINAPVQLAIRNRIEDKISFFLSLDNSGVWTNSGTFIDKDKNPTSVDFNFDIYTDVEDYESKFISSLLNNVTLPKGTELTISTIPKSDDEDPELLKKLIIGDLDLVCLVLDITKVSDEDKAKISYDEAVISLLKDIGLKHFTYVDTDEKTYLYFAVDDFHSFAQHLKAVVSESVFVNGAVVFNATTDNVIA